MTATIQAAAIVCIATVKLNSRGERPAAIAACNMVCRIRLYANRPVRSSLRAISGDLQRSTSSLSVDLRVLRSSSTNQRRR